MATGPQAEVSGTSPAASPHGKKRAAETVRTINARPLPAAKLWTWTIWLPGSRSIWKLSRFSTTTGPAAPALPVPMLDALGLHGPTRAVRPEAARPLAVPAEAIPTQAVPARGVSALTDLAPTGQVPIGLVQASPSAAKAGFLAPTAPAAASRGQAAHGPAASPAHLAPTAAARPSGRSPAGKAQAPIRLAPHGPQQVPARVLHGLIRRAPRAHPMLLTAAPSHIPTPPPARSGKPARTGSPRPGPVQASPLLAGIPNQSRVVFPSPATRANRAVLAPVASALAAANADKTRNEESSRAVLLLV